MNPSSSGWINKLLQEIEKNNLFLKHDQASFYDALRACGFIYGSNLDIVNQVVSKNDLTEEELCKANLLLTFYYTHSNSNSIIPFTESIISFYTNINEIKNSYFSGLINEKNLIIN